MILLFTILMAALLVIGLMTGGVIVPLALTWLVAAAPITLGIIEYNFYYIEDITYEITLFSYILAFAFGVTVARLFIFPQLRRPTTQIDSADYLSQLNEIVRFCWWLGMFGSSCLFIDFFISRGGSLSDFAALRSEFTLRSESSSIFGKLAAVSVWSSFYCFIMLLYYWDGIAIKSRLYLAVPVVGYFLTSLLTAGRQAAFQIVVASVLIMVYRPKAKSTHKLQASRRIFAVSIVGTLVAYMGFIAVVRNDGAISDDKRIVLRQLFDYRISDTLSYIETLIDQNLSVFIEEYLTYFTAQIVLFRSFLEVNPSEHYYGLFTFPFMFRQFQDITGMSVIDALLNKTISMERAGVISAGWTTAISSYIQDFGRYGAYPFLVLLGGYSEYTWKKAQVSGDFHDFVIMMLMFMSAIYMPMFPASSDTNFFLLWLFCLLVRFSPGYRTAGRKPAHTA